MTACGKEPPAPAAEPGLPIDVKIARDTVLLYFPTDCEKVDPFERPMPNDAELVAEALVEGPNDVEQRRGATNPFPEGSSVQSVKIADGVLTIDFNERLQNVGGACAAQAIRNSVEATLKRVPGVRRVVITAGGRGT
ncbi:MAG TPA: GerMN domain-containing protein [Thermoanaerobaculia bacterium]|nr:GerMN domain-containing protein [Thermoanaerobaculia bacterium]